MKIKPITILIAALIGSIPLALLWYYYPSLPQEVATSFDFSGNVNATTPLKDLWKIFVYPYGFLVFLVIIPRLDPRGKSYDKIGNFYSMFIVLMMGFFAFLFSAMLFHAMSATLIPVGQLTFFAVGILFIILGNYMPKMKQSYTMGIRTPWTLESPVVWNKTHRVAGPCFMVAGVLMMLATFLPTSLFLPVFIGSLVIAILVPCALSYVYYSQEMKKEGA